MKIGHRFCIAMMMAISASAGAHAATEVVDGIEWTYFISWGRAYLGNLYSNTVSTSTSGAIRVPDMLGGYPVTEIQTRAFRGCDKITSISIPDSVKVIYASAFEGCSSNLFDRTTMPGALLVDGWLVGCAEVPPPHRTVLLNMNDPCFRGIGIGWMDDGSTWPISVIVKDGTENLDGTFREWGTLVSVTLPDSVRNIGFATFEGCTSLVSVAMSQTVTNIADSAFRRCTALESLDLPDTVVSLGWDAFGECESLRELSIPNVRNIPEGAFMMCRSLERIDFSPAITNIGWAAFAECEALRTMPDLHGLSVIVPYSFHRCASLTEAIIPNSVTNIGEYAFSCCSNLVTVVLPSGLRQEDLGYYYGTYGSVFDECPAIRHVILQGTWEGEEDELQRFVPLREVFPAAYADIESVVFLEGTTAIGYWTLEGCNSLRFMTIPDSVEWLEFDGWWARNECPDLVDWESSPGFGLIAGWIVASDYGISGDLDLSSFRGISCMAFSNTTNAFSISALPAAMTSIARGMFGNGCSITSIVVHAGVTNIGDCAFSYCGKLESVSLSDGLQRIGQQAFEGCAISSIEIPDSVTEIGYSAFNGCSGIWSFSVGDNNPVYASENGLLLTKDRKTLLYGINGDVVIPDGVETVEGSAFSDCEHLYSVAIPASVTSMDSWTFSGCSSLAGFSIDPANSNYASVNGLLLTKDGKQLVSAVSGDVVIPDGVTDISSHAFSSRYGVTSISIPNTTTNLGTTSYNPFHYCSSIKSFSVSADNPCFSSQNGLLLTKDGKTLIAGINGDVMIPDGVTLMATEAFCGLPGLTSLSMPRGLARLVYHSVFQCTNLVSLTIPNSVKSAAYYSLGGCSGLASAFIPSHLQKALPWLGISNQILRFYDSPVDWGRFDGMNGWDFTLDETRADGFCLKSASVDAGETAAMEATLDAATAGTLSFDWRISSGRGHYAKLYVDGVACASISRSTDWAALRIPLGKGTHTLRWTYEKGYGATDGEDCAYLDAVSWTSEVPETVAAGGVTLPGFWLEEKAAALLAANGRDYAAAANATAANGVNKVWECYVAGLDPADTNSMFRAIISWRDGMPVIDWEPDLNDGGTKQDRVYIVEGRENLTSGSWGPTNATSRFFRVKVALP